MSVFSVGKPPANGKAFNQGMYTRGPLPITGGPVKAGHDRVAVTHGTARHNSGRAPTTP